MKRIVVTGATSMLGIALIEKCISKNIFVLAIIRKNSPKKCRIPISPYVKICECNLNELNSIEVEEHEYDVFYHFAWECTSREGRDNPLLQVKNIEYTLDAIKLAHKLCCKKFLFAGSQAEYGLKTDVITATTEVDPQVSYGVAKYAAGKLGKKLCDSFGMIHIWCRIFSVYGTNDSPNTMISYALRQFEKGETAIFSSGTQNWNFLFESDAGEIFFRLGIKCLESNIYCVAHPISKPLKEFITELKEVLGDRFCYELSKETEKRLVSLLVDAESLYKTIDYTPEVNFKDGIEQIRKTINV